MSGNRKLAAILAADVVGFSTMMQADEAGTLAVLKQRRKDVEFVRFPDEDHELSRSGRPSHRVDRFNVILDYWQRKL